MTLHNRRQLQQHRTLACFPMNSWPRYLPLLADSHTFLTDKYRHKAPCPWKGLYPVASDYLVHTLYLESHVLVFVDSKIRNKLLSDWLTRSGVWPLTINLLFCCEDGWTDTIPMDLIQPLLVSAKRWRYINIVLPESWYSILIELKHSFPLLVTVVSQSLCSDCALSPSKRKQLDLFEFASLLRDFHINGHYLSDVDAMGST